MNRSLAVLLPMSVIALVTFGEGAAGSDQGGLSLAIVAGKANSGGPIIDYNKKFQVLLTNRSKEPIRLWSERCQLGHSTLSFRVEDGSGPPTIMRKRIPDASVWEANPPKTITIPAGASYRWNVAPTDIFCEWIEPPAPNTGTPLRLTAIFEIKPTEPTKQQDVWTGRIVSEPLKTLVTFSSGERKTVFLETNSPK